MSIYSIRRQHRGIQDNDMSQSISATLLEDLQRDPSRKYSFDTSDFKRQPSRMRQITSKMKMAFWRRAVAVMIVVVVFLVIMNLILVSSGATNSSATTAKDKVVDSVYFTTTTMSSVGYGDILPTTNLAKVCVSMEHLIVLAFGFGIISLSKETQCV